MYMYMNMYIIVCMYVYQHNYYICRYVYRSTVGIKLCFLSMTVPMYIYTTVLL